MTPADTRPLVLSIHGAHALSGVSTWVSRLLLRPEGRYNWRVLIVGTEAELECAAEFPAFGTDRVDTLSWSADGRAATDRVDTLRARLRTLNPAVVVPNYVPEAYAAAGLEAPAGVRTLGVCHSRDHWYLELFQSAAPLMHAAWAVSRECESLVRSTLTHELPLVGAPYGTEIPDSVAPLPRGATPDAPIRLLYSGRLESLQKRAGRLAALAVALDRQSVPFVMTIAGDGPEGPRLRERLTSFIDDGRVRMPGRVSHERMNALIIEHDVLVLVSAFEGTPLAAIEAMAQGRPIVVTGGCGGATDAVREDGGGVIASGDDLDAMASEIATLQKDPAALGALARRARAVAIERFGYERHLAELESAVDAALERPQVHDVTAAWDAIGRATALAIGGWHTHIDRAAMRRWRSRYLREHAASIGRAGGVRATAARAFGWPAGGPRLAVRAPAVERLGSRLLAAAVQELTIEGCERIAVFPAGRHSDRFGFVLARFPSAFCFVDDGADDGSPRVLHGLPVFGPRAALEQDIDAVIVSSDQYEEALEERAREWAGNLPVRTLYVPVRIPGQAAGAPI